MSLRHVHHPAPPAGVHDLISGQHGQVALYVAVGALVLIAISRKRKSAGIKLTEVMIVASAAFCAFWPGFHHAKPGPRILVFVILAVVILVLRSMYRHAVKGKQDAKPASGSSGFYPAPRQTAGRGGRR